MNPVDDPAKRKNHWEKVWSTSEPNDVSWYQESPEISLRLIEATGVNREAHIVDVGGGFSTLVDNLLEQSFENISVLDVSMSAIKHAQARLGALSRRASWIVGDVMTFRADKPIELWHDRAVLHFMTDKRELNLYVQSFTESVAPNGHAIIATFALDGPTK